MESTQKQAQNPGKHKLIISSSSTESEEVPTTNWGIIGTQEGLRTNQASTANPQSCRSTKLKRKTKREMMTELLNSLNPDASKSLVVMFFLKLKNLIMLLRLYPSILLTYYPRNLYTHCLEMSIGQI